MSWSITSNSVGPVSSFVVTRVGVNRACVFFLLEEVLLAEMQNKESPRSSRNYRFVNTIKDTKRRLSFVHTVGLISN